MAYLTLDEFAVLGGPEDVIAEYAENKRLLYIDAAVAEANEYLSKQYTVPLADGSVTPAMKLHLARMAFYHLISSSGYSPDSDDKALRYQYEDAMNYFRRIAIGTVLIPGGTGSSSGGGGGSAATPPGGPTPAGELASEEPRGW